MGRENEDVGRVERLFPDRRRGKSACHYKMRHLMQHLLGDVEADFTFAAKIPGRQLQVNELR